MKALSKSELSRLENRCKEIDGFIVIDTELNKGEPYTIQWSKIAVTKGYYYALVVPSLDGEVVFDTYCRGRKAENLLETVVAELNRVFSVYGCSFIIKGRTKITDEMLRSPIERKTKAICCTYRIGDKQDRVFISIPVGIAKAMGSACCPTPGRCSLSV